MDLNLIHIAGSNTAHHTPTVYDYGVGIDIDRYRSHHIITDATVFMICATTMNSA